jgi:hypothetical protein
MNLFSKLTPEAELSATITRADGSHRDMLLSRDQIDLVAWSQKLDACFGFWHRLYRQLKRSNAIPVAMTFGAFYHWAHTGDPNAFGFALVTTAGVNYLAADFLSGSSNHISAFNFHDSGTGTTAAAIGDTTLQTQAGPTTRATGTQSNPVAGTYRSVGTISYVSTLAITEWGLFSQAAQGGTLWDHRIFSALNVSSGDSITYTYSVAITAGGS